jgi:hypothetical protein
MSSSGRSKGLALLLATATATATAALAGCSAHARPAPTAPSGSPATETGLTATLTSPTDMVLSWTSHRTDVAQWAVEFATDPGGPYTNLRFLPARTTTYRHPDLMPDTHFYYRVRPVLGPASRPVEVTLPPAPSRAPDDDGSWAVPTRGPQPAVARASIRDPGSAAAATPTDLRGTVVNPTGIRFTWTDRASDEEGYLVEVRPAGAADYSVDAVLDPDVNTFGLVAEPDERVASYRVRAYFYGPPSNVARQTTGH